jgi:hypothetical protein
MTGNKEGQLDGYYHSFMPVPYSLDVQEVLEDADTIVEAAEEMFLSDPHMEPVPLGPQGVRSLVKELPLMASGALLHTNEIDLEAFFAALNPLMHDSAISSGPRYGGCEDSHNNMPKRKLEQQQLASVSKNRRCSLLFEYRPPGAAQEGFQVRPSTTTSHCQSSEGVTELQVPQSADQQLINEEKRFRSY